SSAPALSTPTSPPFMAKSGFLPAAPPPVMPSSTNWTDLPLILFRWIFCRGFFQLRLFVLLILTCAPYFNILAPRGVNERAFHVILRGYVHTREAPETLLEFIHAPHFFTWFQNFWDGSKIEVGAATCLGPLEAAVL